MIFHDYGEDVGKKIPFKEGLFKWPLTLSELPYLIGSRCKLCQRSFFPKRIICPFCFKDDVMEEIRLSRKGKLVMYSVIRVAPLGFKAPYVQGFVDLPEGVRILTQLTNCESCEDALEIGMEVELVIEKIRDAERGNEIIGYKFRPVK